MNAIPHTLKAVDEPLTKLPSPIPANQTSQRVASIDWMRGLVMVLMIIDHASMAFDARHLDHDSSMYFDAGTMAFAGGRILPALASAPMRALVRVSDGCFPGLERGAARGERRQQVGD